MGMGATERWDAGRAAEWRARVGPLAGCNYLPSTAVNSTAMWDEATFDPTTIQRELGWARDLGYNSLRVFLSFLVWSQDTDRFARTFERFLDIAHDRGMTVMPVLFDDCGFSGKAPYPGPQADPVLGLHNSGWVPCPGLGIATDRARWPDLRRYVQDIMRRHDGDERIIAWDLYNEPGNTGAGKDTLPLLREAFAWAREVAPDQPLTAGVWMTTAEEDDPEATELMLSRSDVTTFHIYGDAGTTAAWIARIARDGRPLICTEWLHRLRGSTVAEILPVFEAADIGWYHWGLVAGRTQTWLPWPADDAAGTAVWLADLLHEDGRSYDHAEIELLKAHIARRRDAP